MLLSKTGSASEIHGIWRQGATVTVIESDAAFQREWEYRGRVPAGVKGRGGTLFDPAFEWLNNNRFRRYDACIYLTDGYAPKPSIRPYCKLLWVICPGGTSDSIDFGRAIELK